MADNGGRGQEGSQAQVPILCLTVGEKMDLVSPWWSLIPVLYTGLQFFKNLLLYISLDPLTRFTLLQVESCPAIGYMTTHLALCIF